jgi:hypothetical protein
MRRSADMRKQLAIALLIIGAGTAHARLEENITQCDQRYNIGGKSANADPLDGVSPLIRGPNTSHVVYRHDGWKIRIGYLNTIAVVVEYRRLDHGKLDDAQFQLLLNVNSGGGTWTRSSPGLWIRNDGATASRNPYIARFESLYFKRHQEQLRLQKERSKPQPGTRL